MLPSFDEMVRLAQEDPGELERIKREEIEAVISSAPEDRRKRLEGLQWKIDARMRSHKCAMGRLMEVQRMMMDSFMELRDKLKEVVNIPYQG